MVAAELVIAVHMVWGEISKGGCWVKGPELFQSADVTKECQELWEQGEGFPWNPRLMWVGKDIKTHLVPPPAMGRYTFH